MTQNEIRKAIGGKALLEYEENPAFISFRLLSTSAARSAIKKLISFGYNAKLIKGIYIKVCTS